MFTNELVYTITPSAGTGRRGAQRYELGGSQVHIDVKLRTIEWPWEKSGLSRDPRVATVYLFGSRARGSANADSAVDLALLYRGATPQTLLDQPFEAQEELSHTLGAGAERMTGADFRS